MAINRTRSLRYLASLVAVSFLLAPSAEAQRKKPKKKPAATAKSRSGTKPAPPAAAAPAAPAAPAAEAPAAPEPEAEPEPMPAKKGKPAKSDDTEAAPPPADNAEADTGVEKKHGDKASPSPLLDAEIGLKGFQRHLAYQGDVNNVIPDYDLGGAPAVALDVAVYPVRTSSFALGITGGFEKAFSIGTTYRDMSTDSTTHTTSSSAYSVGARGNLLFGSSSAGLGLEYGALDYSVDLPAPTTDNMQVPKVAYRFIRPSLNGRFGLGGSFALLAGVGYLYVMSAGDIVSDAYFRGSITTLSGYDVNLGLAWAPVASMKAFEVRPMFAYRHFGFTFKPDPTDTYQASGAHDNYLSLALMVGVRL